MGELWIGSCQTKHISTAQLIASVLAIFKTVPILGSLLVFVPRRTPSVMDWVLLVSKEPASADLKLRQVNFAKGTCQQMTDNKKQASCKLSRTKVENIQSGQEEKVKVF